MSITPYGFGIGSVRSVNQKTSPHAHVSRKTIALVPEEFALRNGNPQVPAVWIEAESLVSAEGIQYRERESALDLFDNAYARFVATDETWDSIGYAWNPYLSKAVSRYQMDGDPLSSPSLSTFGYVNGKELIESDCLTFESGDLLTSNFNEGADDAWAMTMGMAVSLKTPGPYNVLTFLDGSYIKVVPAGLQAKIEGKTFGVSIPKGPTYYEVLYIVLDITPPKVTLLAGYSPTKMYRGSSTVKNRTTSFTFTLTGQMDLFSFDIWAGTRPNLTGIFGGYSSVYGAF